MRFAQLPSRKSIMLLHPSTVAVVCVSSVALIAILLVSPTKAENETPTVITTIKKEESLMDALASAMDKLQGFHNNLVTVMENEQKNKTKEKPPTPEEQSLWKKMKQKINNKWNSMVKWVGGNKA
ncbi:uncharacterized protein LOC134209515 [Armigeres subalbatus]|uniref:uncharacterized protein LOC134209515 n=1 Tax=Armigeres subalbatus TaxID=124917 RepID=UPI002ED6A8C9